VAALALALPAVPAADPDAPDYRRL